MALQIRRGLAANLPVSPADGELLYATDTNKLYVGDGGTAQEILGGGLANLVEDTSPQLGGALDVNGYSIVTTGNGSVIIDPSGTGSILLRSTTIVGSNDTSQDGNLIITRNTYAAGTAGFTFAQHHETAKAVNFTFYRTRGTGSIPTAVVGSDRLGDILFLGHDGVNPVAGAQISAVAEGSPVTGHVPSRLAFITNNGTTTATRVEITAGGALRSNNIQNYSSTDLNLTGTGTVSATNSIISSGTATLAAGTVLTVTGTVTGGSLIIGSILSGGTTSVGTRITAVNSATFTSTISTTTLTVSSVSVGTVSVGMALSGGSVTAGTYVVAFVSGVNGGAGVYTLNQSATGTPTTGTSYTVSSSQLVRSTTITSGGNVNLVGNVKILGQNSLRFADADSSNYVAFQAPASVGSNITWTLPSTTGIAGEVLTAGGGGVLSWSAPLASAAPETATSAGMTGQIAFDATHIYVCIAPATWVRATLATWS